MRTSQARQVRVLARLAAGGACFLAATLGLSGVALGQTTQSGHSANRHERRVAFSLSGLVQAKQGRVLEIYVQRGKIGAKHVRGTIMTVTLPDSAKKAKKTRDHAGSHALAAAKRHDRAPVVGDVIDVSGMDVISGDQSALQVSHDNVETTRSTLVVGTVTAVTGTTILLAPLGSASGDNTAGSTGAGEDNLSVDASQATVTLNGASPSASSLSVGETVAVIGEKNDGDMLAATVLAYSVAPGIAIGNLSSVSGSVLTLSSGDGSGGGTQAGNDSSPTTSVEANEATIYLNGVAGATVAQLSTGDSVIAIGTAGSDPLAATTVFDFNSGDNNPTGDNSGNQGDS